MKSAPCGRNPWEIIERTHHARPERAEERRDSKDPPPRPDRVGSISSTDIHGFRPATPGLHPWPKSYASSRRSSLSWQPTNTGRHAAGATRSLNLGT